MGAEQKTTATVTAMALEHAQLCRAGSCGVDSRCPRWHAVTPGHTAKTSWSRAGRPCGPGAGQLPALHNDQSTARRVPCSGAGTLG